LFAAPLVLGEGLSWCGGPGRALARTPRGRIVSMERVGDDALLLVELGG